MKDILSLVEILLKKNGYKLTKQRINILESIYQNNTHLSAEELHEKLKNKNIGFATIYRNLKMLTELGIIKEISLNNMSYYEPKMYSKKSLHIHFKCRKCSNIIDVDDEKIIVEYLKINRVLENKSKLLIEDADILLKGICKECMQ
jgi:Fe2+ or Zn2+ uptake regulation protein